MLPSNGLTLLVRIQINLVKDSAVELVSDIQGSMDGSSEKESANTIVIAYFQFNRMMIQIVVQHLM